MTVSRPLAKVREMLTATIVLTNMTKALWFYPLRGNQIAKHTVVFVMGEIHGSTKIRGQSHWKGQDTIIAMVGIL